jgi:hypothetical protein
MHFNQRKNLVDNASIQLSLCYLGTNNQQWKRQRVEQLTKKIKFRQTITVCLLNRIQNLINPSSSIQFIKFRQHNPNIKFHVKCNLRSNSSKYQIPHTMPFFQISNLGSHNTNINFRIQYHSDKITSSFNLSNFEPYSIKYHFF